MCSAALQQYYIVYILSIAFACFTRSNMRLRQIEENLRSLQDFGGQLADFSAWLESVERPLEALHGQTEDKVAREDRDRVQVWLQQLQVCGVL